MSLYDHTEYMRGVSERVGGIASFIASTDWGHLTQLVSQIQDYRTPCLIADYDYAAAVVDLGSDNVLLRAHYGVMLLMGVAPGDGAGSAGAMREARRLMGRVAGCMLADKRSGHPHMGQLEVGSIRIEAIAPTGDSAVGVAMGFTLLTAPDGEFLGV